METSWYRSPRWRRIAGGCAATAAAALIVAACGSTSGSGSSGSGSSGGSLAARSTFTIGVISDTTGPDAAFGNIFENSEKLVFNAVHTIAGHPIKFVYLDDASNPSTATSVARQAVQQDNASVLYGQPYTETALSTAQVAEALKVPYFNPGASAPALTQPLQKYVFAAQYNAASGWGQAISKIICSMKGIKKIGMLYENDTYGQQNLAAVKQYLPSCGLTVNDAQPIDATATDATPELNNLASAGSQIVIDGTVTGPTMALLKAEAATNFYAPMLSFAGDTPAVDQAIAQNPKYVFYTVDPAACPVTQSCAAPVRTAFGSSSIDGWNVEAYGEAKAFMQAITAYLKNPGSGILHAFDTLDYSTPTLPSPVKFSATNHRGLTNPEVEGFKNGTLSFFGRSLDSNTLSSPITISNLLAA